MKEWKQQKKNEEKIKQLNKTNEWHELKHELKEWEENTEIPWESVEWRLSKYFAERIPVSWESWLHKKKGRKADKRVKIEIDE